MLQGPQPASRLLATLHLATPMQPPRADPAARAAAGNPSYEWLAAARAYDCGDGAAAKLIPQKGREWDEALRPENGMAGRSNRCPSPGYWGRHPGYAVARKACLHRAVIGRIASAA